MNRESRAYRLVQELLQRMMHPAPPAPVFTDAHRLSFVMAQRHQVRHGHGTPS